jgi:hypothetical protein
VGDGECFTLAKDAYRLTGETATIEAEAKKDATAENGAMLFAQSVNGFSQTLERNARQESESVRPCRACPVQEGEDRDRSSEFARRDQSCDDGPARITLQAKETVTMTSDDRGKPFMKGRRRSNWKRASPSEQTAGKVTG